MLAPAGSAESLKAAVNSGADAVYFGGQSFNARRNAENFDDGDIFNAVKYCHERGVKAYITLNTLIFQNELGRALDFAKITCQAGADALILQDVGIARLIKNAAPEMKLHASTQMSIHSPAGVKMAEKLGFSRVVLARELSRSEIAQIADSTKCELEVFVHGALCMSVSGQCYLSGMLGGRSANRGLCAQPCRLPFSAGKAEYCLSLKDLSLVKSIGELSALGVRSLKIEGRMKRPEYVAAAAYICRRAADGEKISQADLDDLQSVFSRSGFTQGYYNSKIDGNMFGVRSREDVLKSSEVLKRFASLYSGPERPRIKVDFSMKIKSGENLSLTAVDEDGNRSSAQGQKPEAAGNSPVNAEIVAQKLSKTGGTPYYAGNIDIDADEGLFVPVSKINELRRSVLEDINAKRGAPKVKKFDPAEFSTVSGKIVEKNPSKRFVMKNFGQLTDKALQSGAEIIFLPVAELARFPARAGALISQGVRLGALIPRAVFSGETEKLESELASVHKLGVGDALCGGLGCFEMLLKNGYKIHGDFGLNVANTFSLISIIESGAESCVLSFEQTLRQAEVTASEQPEKAGILIYGALPLMLMRCCPLKRAGGCGHCPESIKDRTGESFRILCGGNTTELLNSRPLWMFDKMGDVKKTGAGFVQLMFTGETPGEVDSVLESLEKSEKCAGSFTRGLYYRGVT